MDNLHIPCLSERRELIPNPNDGSIAHMAYHTCIELFEHKGDHECKCGEKWSNANVQH